MTNGDRIADVLGFTREGYVLSDCTLAAFNRRLIGSAAPQLYCIFRISSRAPGVRCQMIDKEIPS